MSGTRSFGQDLGASARVLRHHPALPGLSVAILAVPAAVPTQWVVLAAPLIILGMGWVGTERVWYLRAFRGESISPKEAWATTSQLFWPFLRLGFLVGWVFVPVVLLGLVRPGLVPLAGAIVAFGLDVTLTFVTPKLAFATPCARSALREGVRLMARTWPADGWYVLTPGFAIFLLARTLPYAEMNFPAHLAVDAVSVLIALWFKGAIVRCYDRLEPVVGDGWISSRQQADATRPG